MKEIRRTYDVGKNEFEDLVKYIMQNGFTSDKPMPPIAYGHDIVNHNIIFDGDAPVGDFDYQVFRAPKNDPEDSIGDVIAGISLHVCSNTRLSEVLNKYK